MNKVTIIILLLNATLVLGQDKTAPYLFSKDIYQKIEKDTVAWKYQIGATEFSFTGRYAETLEIWDKNGVRKPKVSEEDSLYFIKSRKVNARDYILEQSKNADVTIINEAHHLPQHRIFTQSLLQGLYEVGYRYLGLEALFDTLINERKYPVLESGYYTKEPEFGNLITEALDIGFTLFGYEASQGKNGKEREIEQATNIQKFIESHPPAKVLLHCGYAHAYENEYPAWGKAMAGRLKENMKIDPFTIDQTLFSEKSDRENNHLFMKLNNANYPIILIDENGQVFNGFGENRQTDIAILHPQTKYINGRPGWQTKGKQEYAIPHSKIKSNTPLMVHAYRNNEFDHQGIPADLIEISEEHAQHALYLKKGKYEIIIKGRGYNVIDRYKIEIR